MNHAKRNYRVIAMVLMALFTVFLTLPSCASEVEQNVLTIETKEGPRVFHVELAVTSEEQEKGLMNLTSMPQDAGMLFVFDNIETRSFWMKDTLIPLDVLFLAEDGTIHHIHHMAKPLDHTQITAARPVKAALEINGGLCGTLGITEGDKVIHPIFRNQLDEQ